MNLKNCKQTKDKFSLLPDNVNNRFTKIQRCAAELNLVKTLF